MKTSCLFASLLAALACGGFTFAGTEDGALSSSVQYQKILQGFSDPINVQIFNDATSGSDSFDYNLFATTPGGNSSTVSGSKAADGGATFDARQFFYDSTNAAFGPNQVSVTLSDIHVPSFSKTQSATVNVLRRAIMGFAVAGGGEVPLSSRPTEPAAAEPSVDPLAFGATGGGESFASAAPEVIGDPPPATPADELDLDSITRSGDPQISITLPTFTDLPPDDPADSPAWNIDVDTTTPGLYNAEFEMNYSDEQDVGGAAAPGSEHGYFGVVAQVTPIGGGQDDVSVWVTVPEPPSAVILLGGVLLLVSSRPRTERPSHH